MTYIEPRHQIFDKGTTKIIEILLKLQLYSNSSNTPFLRKSITKAVESYLTNTEYVNNIHSITATQINCIPYKDNPDLEADVIIEVKDTNGKIIERFRISVHYSPMYN
jgi:ABC-type oligopeptide transport system ATPase subunit